MSLILDPVEEGLIWQEMPLFVLLARKLGSEYDISLNLASGLDSKDLKVVLMLQYNLKGILF